MASQKVPSDRNALSSSAGTQGRHAKDHASSRHARSSRLTVDNILQYASDVPSMQARQASTPRNRTLPSIVGGRTSNAPRSRLTGGLIRQQHLPARSTKVSEKLVLLPETIAEDEDDDEDEGGGDGEGAKKADYGEDNEARPIRDDEEALRRSRGKKGKSYAERLPKARRAEKLARVTAYCSAQAYRLNSTAKFLRDIHGAKAKLYDDCLYAVYHLPILVGTKDFRVRSSPVLRSKGGRAVLDEEMERSERRDYEEDYFRERIVDGEEGGDDGAENRRQNDSDNYHIPYRDQEDETRQDINSLDSEADYGADGRQIRSQTRSRKRSRTTSRTGRFAQNNALMQTSAQPGKEAVDAFGFAEMYVFSYGVAVFWNFSEHQEKDILADLTFYESAHGLPLMIRPQRGDDLETEEFHFEYSPESPRPRVFNDMITLRSGDHMIKLAMSHAIAQSTKLCFFEQRMADQMFEAQHIPRRLALTGKLGLKREEVVRILGALFKSRVDVNLSSNVLDVPSFFWDSEPTLHPLYDAVREYLEIKPRIQVLNERCRVFLDLAEILSDSIADNKMSRLTWIIIILIVISILVTCSEVFLRFGLLTSHSIPSQDLAHCIPLPSIDLDL